MAFWRRWPAATSRPGAGSTASSPPPTGRRRPWLKVQRVGGEGGIHLDLDVEGHRRRPSGRSGSGRASWVTSATSSSAGRRAASSSASLGGLEHPRGQARAGAESLIDQVCLDVLSSGYAAEAPSGRSSGWAVDDPDPDDEFVRLAWPRGIPVRFLLQRLDESEGLCAGTSTSPPSTAWPRSSATGASAHTKRVRRLDGRRARPATGTASLIGTRVMGRWSIPDQARRPQAHRRQAHRRQARRRQAHRQASAPTASALAQRRTCR